MNPLAELQAMASGGGGAPAPAPGGGMPPGTPPAMGNAMGQRAGGGIGALISQFIGQMMQDPHAMASIGGVLSDMAGPQNAPPPGAMPPMGMGTENNINPGHDGPMMEGVSPAPGTTAELEGQDPAEAMVAGEMTGEGETEWEGSRAPTEMDIERLRTEPTDSVVESFDAHFGDGAAARYMDEPEDDPGDHEYR